MMTFLLFMLEWFVDFFCLVDSVGVGVKGVDDMEEDMSELMKFLKSELKKEVDCEINDEKFFEYFNKKWGNN